MTREDARGNASPVGTVAICVASYKRPELLHALLLSIENAELPPNVRVIVVDNDPQASAAEVAQSSTLDVEYVVEPVPGIAAARNASLASLDADDSFAVFVDDDERVSHGWLPELLRIQAERGADVVAGPVLSVFPEGTPRWITRGGFIQRVRFQTGDPVRSPATNNTLLSLEFWRAAGSPRFDESYSLTGGSDTAFFRVLSARSPLMLWADDALVWEDVPLSRATFTWIWRRGIREGNVSGRLRLAHVSRPRLFADGVLRIIYGASRQLGELVLGRGPRSRSVAYITRGVGWVGASTGRLVVEYSRAPRATRRSAS